MRVQIRVDNGDRAGLWGMALIVERAALPPGGDEPLARLAEKGPAWGGELAALDDGGESARAVAHRVEGGDVLGRDRGIDGSVGGRARSCSRRRDEGRSAWWRAYTFRARVLVSLPAITTRPQRLRGPLAPEHFVTHGPDAQLDLDPAISLTRLGTAPGRALIRESQVRQ